MVYEAALGTNPTRQGNDMACQVHCITDNDPRLSFLYFVSESWSIDYSTTLSTALLINLYSTRKSPTTRIQKLQHSYLEQDFAGHNSKGVDLVRRWSLDALNGIGDWRGWLYNFTQVRMEKSPTATKCETESSFCQERLFLVDKCQAWSPANDYAVLSYGTFGTLDSSPSPRYNPREKLWG